MAIGARYTSQRPYVGTQTQTALVDALEKAIPSVSKSAVLRYALNKTFGLTMAAGTDGEVPKGETFTDLVARGVALMTGEALPAVEEDEDEGILA